MPGFKQTILEFKTPASAANIGTSVKKGKKLKEGRTWGVQHLDLCDGTPLGQTGSAGGVGSAGGKVGLETSGAVGGVTGAGEVGAAGRGSRSALAVGEGAGSGAGACVDVLKEIRAQGAPVCYSLFLILLRYSSFSFIIPHYSSLFLVIPCYSSHLPLRQESLGCDWRHDRHPADLLCPLLHQPQRAEDPGPDLHASQVHLGPNRTQNVR